MNHDKPARYNLLVKNRPGELLKLTKFLSDAEMDVSALRIANFGASASIEFVAPRACVLPAGFRKNRIE